MNRIRSIVVGVALLAALSAATPAMAARPNPDGGGKVRICVKTSSYPPPFGAYRCYWR